MALLAAAACAALLAVLWSGGGGDGETGTYAVRILGPGAQGLFDGDVEAAEGTPLAALRAAAQEAGLALDVRGSDCLAYVAAIGSHREKGADGWLYWVHRDGAWEKPGMSAGCHPLRAGDEVLWTWSANPSPQGSLRSGMDIWLLLAVAVAAVAAVAWAWLRRRRRR